MEGHSRTSKKHLLLQVWCGLLTVAMLVMASVIASIKIKSNEDDVATVKPNHFSPKGAPFKSNEFSLSYIQLINSSKGFSWDESLPECDSCSLVLRSNSISCERGGLFFMYVQVPFRKDAKTQKTKSVNLVRGATFGKTEFLLVEGIYPSTTETVWLAKIVSLEKGDSVILNISEEFLNHGMFWGAYQLR